MPKNTNTRAIRIVLTDCDGVLTDAGVYYSDRGESMTRFSVRDGMGVKRLRTLRDIETGIITGGNSAALRRRCEWLGISELHQAVENKKAIVSTLLHHRGLDPAQMAYIGDDVNDLEVLAMAGLSACPSDAVEQVKQSVHLVLAKPGGHGAFREFADWIIENI